MNPLLILAVIGIALGAGLISFTFVMRSRLPHWSVITFTLVGVLIAVSCILIMAGASMQ